AKSQATFTSFWKMPKFILTESIYNSSPKDCLDTSSLIHSTAPLYKNVKSVIIFLPTFFESSINVFACSNEAVKGFSIRICLPASRHFFAKLKCVFGGVEITTPSNNGSVKISSTLVVIVISGLECSNSFSVSCRVSTKYLSEKFLEFLKFLSNRG